MNKSRLVSMQLNKPSKFCNYIIFKCFMRPYWFTFFALFGKKKFDDGVTCVAGILFGFISQVTRAFVF